MIARLLFFFFGSGATPTVTRQRVQFVREALTSAAIAGESIQAGSIVREQLTAAAVTEILG